MALTNTRLGIAVVCMDMKLTDLASLGPRSVNVGASWSVGKPVIRQPSAAGSEWHFQLVGQSAFDRRFGSAYAIDVGTPMAYYFLSRQHGRCKVSYKIFEELLQTARARRHARRQRLARLILGVTAPPASSPSDVDVRLIRGLTGLSQAKFAELIGIELATLRNWEQGRRDPTGPARALLRAIRKDPVAVIKALGH